MKRILKTGLVVIVLTVFGSGCARIEQSVYIQNVDIGGPINQPPLNITNAKKAHSITLSPKVYINTQKNYSGLTGSHTSVNSMGIYQVDTVYETGRVPYYSESSTNSYSYKGKNLNWQLPDASVGVNADIALTDHFAINGGVNYSEINQNKLVNGSVGLGFFSEKDGSAIRIDFGLMFQNTYYDASSVVITTIEPAFSHSDTEISFYRDQDKSSSSDFYASFMYNSTNKNSLVNFFFNFSYFGQTLLDYRPKKLERDIYPFSFVNETTSDNEIKAEFFAATPGIYTYLSDWGRLSLGVGFLKELNINYSGKSLFITPVIQFDMLF